MMVIQQSTAQRNQRIAANALYATIGLACGSELYGVFHQQYLRILTLEYSIVYATSFVLAYTFAWLTAKRNVQISITQSGMEISHDEDGIRFAWHEVKRVKQPAVLRRHWLFELTNSKKVKVSTHYFTKKQVKQLKNFIDSISGSTGNR